MFVIKCKPFLLSIFSSRLNWVYLRNDYITGRWNLLYASTSKAPPHLYFQSFGPYCMC